jgi:signal transduction histidine kinase/CheY-like chemotaxis protein
MNPHSALDLRTVEERVLILAPSGRDAPTVAEILQDAGLVGEIHNDLASLCDAFEHGGGAGAALIAEEALGRQQHILRDCLDRQPPWSDLPVVLVAASRTQAGQTHKAWAAGRFADISNVMLLERPLRSATLITALRSALRARRRQYQVREHLREREEAGERLRAHQAELRRLNEGLEQRVIERTRELEKANRRLVAEMEDRRRIEQALLQAQKMEAVGQLTGGVAHDFNNLLSAVLGNLELLDQRLEADQTTRRLVRSAARAAERGAKLTQQLLAFARRQHLQPEPVDINAAVGGMSDLLARTIGGTIRFRTALQPDLWPALADPSQIELVILNLAINARDAMPLGGSLLIEAMNVPESAPERPDGLAPGDFVRIAVTDTGTGMSEEVLAKAFEPFFTTKDVGKGTGLGLSQVYGVAKQSGGDVRIRSAVGQGTTVEVYLPRAGVMPNRSAGDAPVRGEVRPTHATILLVDDDPDVRDFIITGLESLGYDVRSANSPHAALEILGGQGEAHLLLVDYAMPGMTGAEVARAARARRPDLPIVLITGYAEMKALSNEPEFFDAMLRKPFKLAELAATVETALQHAVQSSAAAGGNVVPLPSPSRSS